MSGSSRRVAPSIVAVVVAAALGGGIIGYLIGGSTVEPIDATAPPSASLEPPLQLALGEEGATRTGSTVKVLTWNKGTPEGWPDPPEGFEYSKALVEFCSGPGVWNFRVRQIPYLFNLVDADPAADVALPPPYVDTWNDLQEFASYNQAVLSPDECIVGTIVFANRETQSIRAVRFTGHGRFEWDVAAIDDGSMPAPVPSYSPGPFMLRPGDVIPSESPSSPSDSGEAYGP